jgi:hypothetical protein
LTTDDIKEIYGVTYNQGSDHHRKGLVMNRTFGFMLVKESMAPGSWLLLTNTNTGTFSVTYSILLAVLIAASASTSLYSSLFSFTINLRFSN